MTDQLTGPASDNWKPAIAVRGRSPKEFTIAGMGIVALGFIAILIGWGRVAGEDDVHSQLPSMVAFGLGGIALVCAGIAMAAVGAIRADAARDLHLLRTATEELRALTELRGMSSS